MPLSRATMPVRSGDICPRNLSADLHAKSHARPCQGQTLSPRGTMTGVSVLLCATVFPCRLLLSRATDAIAVSGRHQDTPMLGTSSLHNTSRLPQLAWTGAGWWNCSDSAQAVCPAEKPGPGYRSTSHSSLRPERTGHSITSPFPERFHGAQTEGSRVLVNEGGAKTSLIGGQRMG